MKTILLLSATFFAYFFYHISPNRERISFIDNTQTVQQSMLSLQQLCASIKPDRRANCLVEGDDQLLIFDSQPLGKLDTITVANAGFAGLANTNVTRLLSTVRLLNRNFIAGIYYDAAAQVWLYPYQTSTRLTNDIYTARNIFIPRSPNDTSRTAFSYYFNVIDRQKQMLLLSTNDVRYKHFSK